MSEKTYTPAEARAYVKNMIRREWAILEKNLKDAKNASLKEHA